MRNHYLTFAIGVASIASQLQFALPSLAGSENQLFGGGDFTEKLDSQFGYFGVNTYLNGDTSDGGNFLSVIGGLGHYDYKNNLVSGGEVDGYISNISLLWGYKTVQGDLSLSGQLGVEYRNRNLKPNDPAADTEGNWVGAKFSLESEYDSRGLFFNGFGEYSTINNASFARGRIGPNLGSIAIGPEVAWVSEDGWAVYRYGAFSRIKLDQDTKLIMSVGNAVNKNGNGGDGYYVSTGFDLGF